MDDFFRFIRLSSTRLFGGRRASSNANHDNANDDDNDDDVDEQQRQQRGSHLSDNNERGSSRSGNRNSNSSSSSSSRNSKIEHGREAKKEETTNYVITACKHVSDNKWEDIWNELFDSRHTKLTGVVFINPTFARTFYVPLSVFRCDYDDFGEYQNVDLESLTLLKHGRYERWMQSALRPDACCVLLHACSAALLLDQLCSRCPNVTRLSMHFYHLDANVIAYIVRRMSNLVSLNLENSIGLVGRSYAMLRSLVGLRHLNLSGTDLSELALTKILDNCHSLETLNVSNNCAITGHCLANRRVKHLRRLSIRDCWSIDSKRLIEMTTGGMPNLIELLCNSGITDESLAVIGERCSQLAHLDISFEEFTYHDDSGYQLLTDAGFAAIAQLIHLRLLRLRHIGKLSNSALAIIMRSCSKLEVLTLNVRHRHRLTDDALADIARNCPRLKSFEAVHNHFIGKRCVDELASLTDSLQCLILRGDEAIQDEDAANLVAKCAVLRVLSLDGCRAVGEKTFAQCIIHARNLANATKTGVVPEFMAGLVCTSVDRSTLNDLQAELPDNLRIRVSKQACNKAHYNVFDGSSVHEYSLRDAFFPFYWHDFN